MKKVIVNREIHDKIHVHDLIGSEIVAYRCQSHASRHDYAILVTSNNRYGFIGFNSLLDRKLRFEGQSPEQAIRKAIEAKRNVVAFNGFREFFNACLSGSF